MKSLERCIILALLLFLSILCKENVFAWEYCNKKTVGETCIDDDLHFMCHTEGDLFEEENLKFMTTEWSEYMPVSPHFRNWIMDLHNEYRNRVASGEEISTKSNKNFPIASRMREFIWDVELEYLCAVSIKMALTIKHDNCRGSLRFAYPGQNLGAGDLFTIPKPVTSGHRNLYFSLINDTMVFMFNEKNYIAEPETYPFSLREEDRKAGHYNQMVNDRSGRMGCSTGIGLNCTNPDPFALFDACWYVCCDFENSARREAYIYKTHATTSASECSDFGAGKSKKYKHLCENTGALVSPYKFGEDMDFDNRFDKVVDKSHLREIMVREQKHLKRKRRRRPPTPPPPG